MLSFHPGDLQLRELLAVDSLLMSEELIADTRFTLSCAPVGVSGTPHIG
jgi:hypothetical protein